MFHHPKNALHDRYAKNYIAVSTVGNADLHVYEDCVNVFSGVPEDR